MAKILAPYTNKCIISFLDFYKKTQRNMQAIHVLDSPIEQKLMLCHKLYDIASCYGLKLGLPDSQIPSG